MPKKSELKDHLQKSVQILKHSLEYSVYCYFMLTVLFFYHTADSPLTRNIRMQTIQPIPKVSAVSGISPQRKKNRSRDNLNEDFSALENFNPELRGVLLPAIPNATIPEADLNEYWKLIDRLQEKTNIFASAESFSHAYEYWISQLAKMTVKPGVGFYTQNSLVRLMVGISKPRAGMAIYDPTVGTGGMLIGSAHYISQHGGNLENTRFYGRETSPEIWAIAKMNLLAHQLENTTIEQGDTLRSSPDAFGTMDLVLQNMPVPIDPGNRGQTHRINAAFLRHAVQALAPGGRAAILAPALILQQDHAEFWHSILSRDWLEAVISLPPKLLHGTTSAACIFVFNKKKPHERHSQVLFIRSPADVVPRSRHHELPEEDLQAILRAFDSWENAGDWARIIRVSQIESQNYSLSMDRYPDLGETPKAFNLPAALNRYQAAVQKREASVKQLMQSLEDLYGSTPIGKDGSP